MDHPLLRLPSGAAAKAGEGVGWQPFSSYDEPVVHRAHNSVNRTVLEVRLPLATANNGSGGRKTLPPEPWTWVRTHGAGRVFYTAWGHDERTWGTPGFADLVDSGLRWVTREFAG